MRLLSILFGLGALACLAPPSRAADKGPAPSALTKADVDGWLDQIVPNAMRKGKIPGGVVVVVRDGQILTERGYGFADLAARRPVDPHETLFRPGSISKTFTWTAVMQLVEEGRIDLDADINQYLDFRIPLKNGKPVTMRTMMTHTSGFEEQFKDLVGPNAPAPLGAYLKRSLPALIFTPGTRPAYSNYASALAGYVVERVSGEPFETYISRHVFVPLAMTHSTFHQPLPAALERSMSRGYLPDSPSPRYFENFAVGPAGGMTTSGDDMAHFMIAHLEGGHYGDARLLQPATLFAMHAIQPRIYPALNGMALGFYEHSRNGHRILAHNGGTQFFHSDLHLFLDDRVGIFISLNSPGVDDAATALHEALFYGFADRYFPRTAPLPAPAIDRALAVAHAGLMAGSWEPNQRSQSNIWQLVGLLGPMTVTANADGTITFPIPHHGAQTWREISPFVWRNARAQDRMQALVERGRPVMMGFDVAPPAGFTPFPTWRSPAWLVPALLAALTALQATGLAWPVAALVRRRRGMPLRYQSGARLSYRAVRGLSLVAVASFAGLLFTLIAMAGVYDRLSSQFDPLLTTAKALSVLAIAATLAVSAYDAVRFWGLRAGRFGRFWSVVVVASAGLLLWTLIVFHAADFSTGY